MFAEEVFEPFARNDQRRWGQVYLRGLLTDGTRCAPAPMARRAGPDTTAGGPRCGPARRAVRLRCAGPVRQIPQVGADQYGDGSWATWTWSLWPG
nr:transposase [Streptomyces hirsutus]